MILYGGCSRSWFLKTTLSPPFREPFAPFGVPAKSGQGSVVMLSCALEVYMRIALETTLLIPTRKWKHSPKSFYRLPDNGNTSCLDFEGCLQWH